MAAAPVDSLAVSGQVRIVHLADFAAPYPGSFIPTLEAVHGAVEARGWAFEAAFPAEAEGRGWYATARSSGMRVRVLPLASRRAGVRRVAALVREHRGPTILHTHFASWDLPATLVARMPRRARQADPVVVIWHRHGTLGGPSTPRVREIVRYGLVGRAVDAHLCVGPGGYRDVLARRAPGGRAMLFPNAIDVDRFPPVSGEERTRARAELGIAPEEPVLAGFIWQWQLKGGPLLLETAAELASRGRRVVTLAVGAGAQAEPEAARLGIGGLVRALPQRPDPRIFYAAADVFLASGQSEGFGFAPLEAVACGTPVVAVDIPGHRHFGAHLPALRLTEPSAKAMADAVAAELSALAEARMRRVRASREYLAEHVGLDAWVERLLGVYDEALLRRGGPHLTPAFAARS